MSGPTTPTLYDVRVAGIGKRPLEGVIGIYDRAYDNDRAFTGFVDSALPKETEIKGEISDGVLRFSLPLRSGRQYIGTLRKTGADECLSGTYTGSGTSVRVEDSNGGLIARMELQEGKLVNNVKFCIMPQVRINASERKDRFLRQMDVDHT